MCICPYSAEYKYCIHVFCSLKLLLFFFGFFIYFYFAIPFAPRYHKTFFILSFFSILLNEKTPKKEKNFSCLSVYIMLYICVYLPVFVNCIGFCTHSMCYFFRCVVFRVLKSRMHSNNKTKTINLSGLASYVSHQPINCRKTD